jgi:hypothetical protein
MAITTTKSGTADNDSIRGIQINREPETGILQIEVFYQVGDASRHLMLNPASNAIRASIEATYTEIKAAINAAEGLS